MAYSNVGGYPQQYPTQSNQTMHNPSYAHGVKVMPMDTTQSPPPKSEPEPGCIKRTKAKYDVWAESKRGVCVRMTITVILCITSIATSAAARAALKDGGAIIQDLVDDWQTEPVLDFVLAVNDTQCPLGYAQEANLHFPGYQADYCICPSGASMVDSGNVYALTTQLGSCNSTQLAQDCYTPDTRLSRGGSLGAWVPGFRGQVCVQRGGQPAYDQATGTRRAMPDDGRGCGSDSKICGTGSYTTATGGATCWPRDVPCPVTQISVIPQSDFAGTGLPYAKPIPSTSYVIAFDNGTLPGRPLVSLDVTLGNTVCIGSDGGTIDFAHGQPLDGLNPKLAYDGHDEVDSAYADSCDTRDTRFTAAMGRAMRDMVTEFLQQPTPCNSSAGPASQTTTAPVDCFNCRADDNVCRLYCQGECTQIQTVADSTPAISATASVRQELWWRQGCIVTMPEVVARARPLQSAIASQTTLLVVNIVINLLTIFIALNLLCNAWRGDACCFPGKGETEKKRLLFCKSYGLLILKASKFTTLISVTILIGVLRHFFANAADTGCGDTLTNDVLGYFKETLQDTYTGNIRTGVIDGVQVLMAVFAFLRVVKTKCC